MINLDTTLLIGLGNPILGDDGVGWQVVRDVEDAINACEVSEIKLKIEYEYLSLGGLSLMERMEGYRNVIVVDSILTGNNPLGTIYCLPLHRLPNFSSGHTTAIHDTSLATALEVGRQMGIVLPHEVWVVAVEAEQVLEFSEVLSSEIEAVVPTAVEVVLDILISEVKNEKLMFPRIHSG